MKAAAIKLRAWDKVNKRMLYFSELRWHDEYNVLYFVEGNLDVPAEDNLIFMLFTLQTDRKRNDLYDGDILRQHKDKGQMFKVFWNKDGMWMVEAEDGTWDYLWRWAKVTEKIGNMFENPKLFKVLK